MKPTSIITTQQLAELAELSPSFFTLRRADLPEAFDVPSASPQGGRPAKAYSLEAIAEFILSKTNFLTDAECRLRVALMSSVRKGGTKMSRFLDDHSLIEIDGVARVLPRDHSQLSPELRDKVEVLLAGDRESLRARRSAARRQLRPRTRTTPEGTPT